MKMICRPLRKEEDHRLKCMLCGNRSNVIEMSDTAICDECLRKGDIIECANGHYGNKCGKHAGDSNEKRIPA